MNRLKMCDGQQPKALVWLSCTACGRPLAPVELVRTDHGVRRVIRVGNLEIYRARVRCPVCDGYRVFRSQRVEVD